MGPNRVWHAIIALLQHTQRTTLDVATLLFPLGCTHSRTTTGVKLHHCTRTACTVGLRRVSHVIIALGKHTDWKTLGVACYHRPWKHIRSDDVGRGIMPSSPLESKHNLTTSGEACYHRPWMAHTIGRHWAWHVSMALEQHILSDDIGRGMPSSPLDTTHDQNTSGTNAIISIRKHTRSDDARHDMPSSPLESIHGGTTSAVAMPSSLFTYDRTTSGVACYHRPWKANTIGRRRAWHVAITLGEQTLSDNIGHGMPAWPLSSAYRQITSGVACHHRHWAAQAGVACHHGPYKEHIIRRRRAWQEIIAFGHHTQGRTTSGVACHHKPLKAHRVIRRQTFHVIIAVGLHTRSNDVGFGNDILALGQQKGSDNIRTTSGVACPHGHWAAHTQSDDVRRYMPSSNLGSTHGRTTSGVACNIALAQHKQSDNVKHGNAIIPWNAHTVRCVGRGMLSSPLESIQDRTTSGVACYHLPWRAYTIGTHRAWHTQMDFGQHTRSDDVGHGIPSSSLDCILGRMTLGMACHYRPWTAHTVK
ncbi:hypothetical protein EJD97_018386 [Solanum chilense]|uniref:Uncharacterized protein n=1 Tax=Solanum chilense TaxID=4083 RepID=A0A6N2B116_SOLCI|nr:hypothetical protein EJD97_018386 [Solanum chilense]